MKYHITKLLLYTRQKFLYKNFTGKKQRKDIIEKPITTRDTKESEILVTKTC